MSRNTRSSEEIETIKTKILDAALAILFEEGFDDLSMRKLGRKLGMTAANIYNYYSETAKKIVNTNLWVALIGIKDNNTENHVITRT